MIINITVILFIRIKISPCKKIFVDNESVPTCQGITFCPQRSYSFTKKKTFEKVSKVKYNGQKVGRLLSVSRNGRKNPPDALAISSRFLKYILPQMIFWIAAAESPVSLK